MIGSWPGESVRLPKSRAERAKVRLLIDFFVWLLAPQVAGENRSRF